MTTQQPIIKLHDGNLMPQLGLGVWQASISETTQAVLKALEVGYRSIDTAAIYKNEEGVGAALQSTSIPRDELFITTKLWNDDQGDPQGALETSLEKLKLDYVDLYLIHWPKPQQDQYVDAWRGLIKLREQGLVKSIGVCNFHTPHLQRLLDETNVAPVINQIELHPLLQQRQLRAWNATHHIATESWSPLAQGGEGVFDQPVDQKPGGKIRENPGANRGALAPGQRADRDPEIGHASAHS
jgi:2,5-diketo-D-gluconate reductase A